MAKTELWGVLMDEEEKDQIYGYVRKMLYHFHSALMYAWLAGCIPWALVFIESDTHFEKTIAVGAFVGFFYMAVISYIRSIGYDE